MTAVYIPFIDIYRLLLNHIVSECAAPSVYCDRTVRLLHRAIFHYAATNPDRLLWYIFYISPHCKVIILATSLFSSHFMALRYLSPTHGRHDTELEMVGSCRVLASVVYGRTTVIS